MPRAEFIDFNGEWHKECTACNGAFASYSLDGMSAFFYWDKSRGDGFGNRCKKCAKENTKKYTNRDKYAADERRKKSVGPEKIAARVAIKNAIRRGEIIRGICHCGSSSLAEAHHPDYSKPLEVVWMCRKCHRDHHRKEKAAREKTV